MSENENNLARSKLMRWLLFSLGTVSLILGVVGIFLPLLPTTPFLLLTAACYLRSSQRFYLWLIHHPRLGRYILGYLDGQGIPRKAKFYTLAVLWCSILISTFIVLHHWVAIALPIIATLVSAYIWRLPEPVWQDQAEPKPVNNESNVQKTNSE